MMARINKSHSTKPLKVALAVLLALCKYVASEPVVNAQVFAKVNVNIMNRLGSGLPLMVHCRSEDDDLGVHTVPDGSDYTFGFRVNFWQTTHFDCEAKFPGVYTLKFPAFDFMRDLKRVVHRSIWLMSQHAVYGFNEKTVVWEEMYHWPR